MTVSRLLDLHADESTEKDITVVIKDGVDGSGSHAIYQQQGNIDTHNIIMYMFCILEMKETKSKKVIFKEKLSGSPFSQRPVFLILGNETLSN